MNAPVAKIKDPSYYLRAVANRATAGELGVVHSLPSATVVAYELADGRRVAARDVKARRGTVLVPGLRLEDGREVALDTVAAIRQGRQVVAYRLADGTEVAKAAETERVQLSRRRVVAYRLSDGSEVAREAVRAVTAGEAGGAMVDGRGEPVSLERVAIRDEQTGRVLGYYSEHGDAPGRWLGRGATDDLGLTGRISLHENREAYERLMAGLHPETGERITRGQPGGERVAGFDVLFTTSKSVSLLYGLTDDPALRAGIEEEWEASVEEAVAHFIDPHLSWSRSGHASSGPDDPYPETLHDVPTSGIVAGAFRHRAGRAGDGHGEDPLLHTHLVITNVTHSLDGVWRAHESTEVYRIGKAAYALQASAFRARLARRFGIQWTTPVNGHAEIRGLDRRDWIEAFSARSDDANLALESAGLTEAVGKGPSAARDFAGSATKHKKESGRSTAELVAEWQGRAAELGLTPEAVRAVLNQGRTGPDRITDKRALRMAEQLTEQSNVFSILDAMEVVAGTSTQGLTVERSMELARELLHGATDEIVPLGKVHELGRRDVIRLADGRVVPMRGAQRGEAAERYTTREILTLESRVIREAHERRLAGVAIVGGESVAKALAAHPDLGRDQVAMIVGLLTDGSGVSVVRAPAGFGKSYALRTAKEGWEADGVPVMATAHMRATATKLGRDVGLVPKAAQNIAALRVWLEAPAAEGRVRLPHGVVLLVDESSVVDLRDLAALERHVSSVSGKLVLVGDPAQLGSIGPAAPLNELPKHVPTYDLVENRRQVEAWEQAALHDLRAGQVAAAVNAYETHGAIKYAKGEGRAAKVELMNDAARDYLEARDQGKTVVLMAATNRDRKALNAVIRSELVRAGEVADEGMKVGDLEVAVGDTLQVLKNSPQFGVSNTDVVKVQMVDKHRRTALVERPDGESVEFSRSFLAKNVAYGHAQTGHKAQGGTWDVALILADAGVLSAQWGYTALTRGAERNRLYFSGPRPVDEMHHQPDEEVPDPELQRQQIVAGLSRDRSEALATEVIAALDQDGRLAAQGLLASAADSSRVAAQRAASDEAAARSARQVATTTRDEEVESLERQRRELDAELGEYDRDRGPTRRR